MIHNGFVYDLIEITPNIMQIVVKRKHKSYYVNIGFLARNEQCRAIKELGVEKQDLVKIDYYLQSKKFNDRYYTDAIIETLEIKQKKSPQMVVDFETGEIS